MFYRVYAISSVLLAMLTFSSGLLGQHFGELDDLPPWWQADSVYAAAGVTRVKVIQSFNTTDPFQGRLAAGRMDLMLDEKGRITHKLLYAPGDTLRLAGAMRFGYDRQGHMVKKQALSTPDLTTVGDEWNYQNDYDSLGRLVRSIRTRVEWTGGDTVVYTYDVQGRKASEYRSAALESSGLTSWKYMDRGDSLTIVTTQHGMLNRRLRKRVDVSMWRHETYNGRGQLKRCTYEVTNDVATNSIGLPVRDDYEYDPLGRLVKKKERIVGAMYVHHYRYNIQELTSNYMYTRIAPEGVTDNRTMVFENLYQFNSLGLLISHCSGGARRDEVQCDRVYYER